MVVLLINKFFYEKGGSERYFFMQDDALRARGHQVVHFSMSHPSNRPSPYDAFFVSQRDYSEAPMGRSGFSHGAEFIRSREADEKLRELIAFARPQVAHLHNIYHQLTPSIIPVLKSHGIPVVLTLHDYKLVCPNYRLFAHGRFCDRCIGGNFLNAPLTRCNDGSLVKSGLLGLEAFVQRITHVYDGVDLFLAPSRYIRDVFIRAGFDKRRVRYLPSFLPPVHDTGADRPAGLPERYVLYFGRLSEEKGLDGLVSAVAGQRDVHLVLAGDGPEREVLKVQGERDCPGRLHFTGYLNKSALDAVITHATVVALPAVWPENAPFTVLEAAAAGVPVIVSSMGGLPEMAEVLSGWVVPPGDTPALASAVAEAWENPERTAQRGERARAAAHEYWNEERHMDALSGIYRSLLEARN